MRLIGHVVRDWPCTAAWLVFGLCEVVFFAVKGGPP
jgi:hypothetical protein